MSSAGDGENGLIELGEAMTDTPSISTAILNTPKAGYTYLGQFIDHDLTLDLTPLSRARGSDLARSFNFRTPRLDLDHLYGGGPDTWPFLYERTDPPAPPRFLIGYTLATTFDGQTFPSTADDLPRSPSGIALVGDPRQDENLVVAQLHVAFLKLHNSLLDDASQLNASRHYRNTGSSFEAARRALTWHYQWIVRYDYLRRILAPEIFANLDVEEKNSRAESTKRFRIPLEFSLGAFRFGHSMVRDDYFLNNTHRQARLLEDILAQTGGGGSAVPRLTADWVIDWRRFFFVGGGAGMARHSSGFDTGLAKGLHRLPGGPGSSSHLAVRTLLRGDRVGLPSGQACAIALGVTPLTPDELASDPLQGPILKKWGYDRETPLWYYVLKEAELLGKRETLGPVGSRIVARVMMDALLSDPGSYLSVAPNWVPTLPGPSDPKLFNMANLLRCLPRNL